jgi:excisionase family DNA binding protein
MADLASTLRRLADRLGELEPAEIIGELEALKFAVWTAATSAEPIAQPRPAEPTPEHLTTKAAAGWLGISPTALRRLEADGQLPAVRIGRRVVFRRDTLDRFRADRERLRGGLPCPSR